MAYLGQSLTEGTRRVYTYTATASQTTFSAVYGVGAVDVYQNGVLLAPTDYTATNGTTVALTVGAAVNDEITIICHNTFSVSDTVSASQGGTFNGDISLGDNTKAKFGASDDLQIYHNGGNSIIADVGTGDLYVAGDNLRLTNAALSEIYARGYANGKFSLYYDNAEKLQTTSTGIDVTGGVSIDDDNNFSFGDGTTYIQGSGAADRIKFITNASEAVRIDSSGNLLVGKTGASSTSTGSELRPTGQAILVADGTNPILMNRQTSDGNIAVFRKDGNPRGAIGTSGNNLAIHGAGAGDDATGLMFVNSGSTQRIVPCQENFTLNDAIINLGHSSNRFKSLYLGSTAYVTHNADSAGAKLSFQGLHTSNNTLKIHQFGQSYANAPAVNQIAVSNAEQHLHLVTDDNATVDAGTSTKGIFLRSGGNVGIGTRSPQGKLDVYQEPSVGWTRSLTRNATKAAFVGVYKTTSPSATNSAGIFAHNSSLTAWDDLWINAHDNGSGGVGGGSSQNIYMGGKVQKPHQPAFRAGRNSNYTAGAGSDIVFDNTASANAHFNIGGHYNTSNGRFTCPVAGTYLFYAQVIYGPSLTNGQAMDDAFYIHRNNSRVSFSAKRAEYVDGYTGNQGYYVDHAQTILNCNANDFITVNNRRQLPVHGNPFYTIFYGYLLG